MRKDDYGDLIGKINKQLVEEILIEEGDLTGRVKIIGNDIAVLVSDVDLRTSKLVLQNDVRGKGGKKSLRPVTN